VIALTLYLISHGSRDNRDLHSFPTRRSSDLEKIAEETRNKMREKMEDIPQDERREKMPAIMKELNDSARKELKDVLKPEQLARRSEEHTSELQSLAYLVCRLLLEKKNKHETT